jgi:hypothetical protein
VNSSFRNVDPIVGKIRLFRQVSLPAVWLPQAINPVQSVCPQFPFFPTRFHPVGNHEFHPDACSTVA